MKEINFTSSFQFALAIFGGGWFVHGLYINDTFTIITGLVCAIINYIGGHI